MDLPRSPARKKARTSDEAPLSSQRGGRRPLDPEARKRRQAAIAAALGQPSGARSSVSSSPASSSVKSPPRSRPVAGPSSSRFPASASALLSRPTTPTPMPDSPSRSGLSNTTNLVLTPRRSPTKAKQLDEDVDMLSRTDVIPAPAFVPSSSAAQGSENRDVLASITVAPTMVPAHFPEPFISSSPEVPITRASDSDVERDPFIVQPAVQAAAVPPSRASEAPTPTVLLAAPTQSIPLLPETPSSPLRPSAPPEVPETPASITTIEPGVFFTASHRRMTLSTTALEKARSFAARIDRELESETSGLTGGGGGESEDDERSELEDIRLIQELKSKPFSSSQSVGPGGSGRKPLPAFVPPLKPGIPRAPSLVSTSSQRISRSGSMTGFSSASQIPKPSFTAAGSLSASTSSPFPRTTQIPSSSAAIPSSSQIQTPSRPTTKFASATNYGTPSTPSFARPSLAASTSAAPPARPQTPLSTQSRPFATPIASSSTGSGTPQRSLGMTPRRLGMTDVTVPGSVQKRQKPFATPWKAGVRPSTPLAAPSTPGPSGLGTGSPMRKGKGGGTAFASASELPRPRASLLRNTTVPSPSSGDGTPKTAKEGMRGANAKGKGKTEIVPANAVFDIRKHDRRKSYRESGIEPRKFNAYDLAALYAIPAELPQITPSNALNYSFFDPSSPKSTEPTRLGAEAALFYLRSKGCIHASQEWVNLQWELVLWKRASTVCCQPELLNEMWTFEATCEGLMYHYERDINRSQRPILRTILERDAPPSRPMILCISHIWWTAQQMNEDGTEIILPHPTFELTDGWYKIRTEVDEALARATRKRTLRVGAKIIVVGAKVEADGEPREALKAYESTTLRISGNSTTLAKWDARLGPLIIRSSTPSDAPIPPVASLRSLTNDGGLVMLVDVVVEKLFPMGFIETLPDGSRMAPVNEAENREAETKWEKQRMRAVEEQNEKVEKELISLAGFVEKASTLARGFVPGENDVEPPTVASIMDDMADASTPAEQLAAFKSQRLSAREYAFLARSLDKALQDKREKRADLVRAEADEICPPRKVSDFRIIIVRDARQPSRTTRTSGVDRTAQLTMWNVLSLGEDFLRVGKRYLVSNVLPQGSSSWAKYDEDGEIILKSTGATRWRAVR